MLLFAVVLAFTGCLVDSASLAVWRLTAAAVYNTNTVAAVGYALQFSSMLLDVTSLGYLPEFTHSVVDAFSLVASLLVSSWLLNESPSRIEAQSALCVLLGILLCVQNRPQTAAPASYADTLATYDTPGAYLWFFAFAAVAAGLRVTAERSGRFGLLPVSAGIIGALCETLAKVMTKRLGAPYVDTAAILAVIFVFIMSELYIIRASLRVLPMYVHQPLFYATWAVGGMLSGGYVYGDFDVYADHPVALWLTLFGVSLVLFGCLLPRIAKETRPRPPFVPGQVSAVLKKLATPSEPEFELEPLSTRTL